MGAGTATGAGAQHQPAVEVDRTEGGGGGLLDAEAGGLLQKLLKNVPEVTDAQIALHAAHLQHAAAVPHARLVTGPLWVRLPFYL